MDKESSLYTRTGFSKQGFGCCGRYTYCNMGRGSCYYDDIDGEVKKHCISYQRHHSKKNVISKLEKCSYKRVDSYLFKDDEVLLVSACFNSHRIMMGKKYFLEEKTKYKSLTQAYVYDLNHKFLGIYSIKDFEILKSITNKDLSNYKQSKAVVPEEPVYEEEKAIEGPEQLSLF